MGGADVRLGEVVLGDVEKAARDGLECPKLGEPKALEVDDDERLAYWSTGGGGCGWEDLGEDGLDVDEDRAPVFLRGYALIEPLGAYRTKALDVYRTAELYTMDRSDVGTDRRRARTVFTLSVWKESGDQLGAEHGNCAWAPPLGGQVLHYCMCVPCGSPLANSQRLRPARETVCQWQSGERWKGQTCFERAQEGGALRTSKGSMPR